MQKFKKGDLVRVAKDLGECMRHFTSDCDAIVIGSYADQFGGSNTKSYTLHIKGGGETSWYEESQISLTESNRGDLLDIWENEMRAEAEIQGDIDWIFENGEGVLKEAHMASVETLAGCFGLTNLWGNRGEGFVYWRNAMTTLKMAEEFLKANDKLGWLAFCAHIQSANPKGG